MSSRTGTLVAAVVVGLLVGIGVGALLWSGSSDHASSTSGTDASSTTSTAVDRRPIALPAALAGFNDITQAMAARHPKAAVLITQRRSASGRRTAGGRGGRAWVSPARRPGSRATPARR